MSKKRRKTLEVVFEDPVRADGEWRDVESLLISLGAQVTESRGSRVKVALNGVRSVFHRPHPGKEVTKGAVRGLRDFLSEAGVRDER
jgi:hypothetical protein